MGNDNSLNLSQAEQELWGLRKASWDDWKSAKQAKLWEAVALSLELDPSNFHFFHERKLDKVFSKYNQAPRFAELLKLAVGNISAGGVLKPVSIDLDSLEESEITLSNFVKWTQSIKVELPHNFPGATPSSAPKGKKPQGENERSTLLALIEALTKSAKLDLMSPSKTAGVIEDFTIRLGSRVSARAIENHLKRIGIVVAKPLESRERTTLSIITTALAKELSLPLNKPATAASLIQTLAQNHGSSIEARVIEDALKRANDALEKRPE